MTFDEKKKLWIKKGENYILNLLNIKQKGRKPHTQKVKKKYIKF